MTPGFVTRFHGSAIVTFTHLGVRHHTLIFKLCGVSYVTQVLPWHRYGALWALSHPFLLRPCRNRCRIYQHQEHIFVHNQRVIIYACVVHLYEYLVDVLLYTV